MGAVQSRSTRRIRKIKADHRAAKRPCWLCGQPIDYDLPHDHPDAYSLDHIKPWHTHPELREDPANCAPAHARCNKSRGMNDPSPGLGLRSRDW